MDGSHNQKFIANFLQQGIYLMEKYIKAMDKILHNVLNFQVYINFDNWTFQILSMERFYDILLTLTLQ